MTGARYQRLLGPDPPGLALPPAEQAAAATLAAIETSARLGRRPALQVTAPGLRASVTEWPGSVRRQAGPRARQVISGLLSQRPRASEPRGAEWLTVSLDVIPARRPSPPAGTGRPGTDPAGTDRAGTGRPGTGPADLDGRAGPDGRAGSEVRGPRISALIRDGLLTVSVFCPPGDLWWRARDAVAETFAEILASTLEKPHQNIASARGLSAVSEQRVLRLAGHAVSFGPFVPVPALAEWQADRHPNRPAVTFRDTTLSYARLDQLANGLARTLTARGITKGQLVPVLIGNSLELPIAWLALMKLGAPFVPLDPAWPPERLSAALGLLAPRVVLHRAAAPPALPPALPPSSPLPSGARPFAVPVDASRIQPSIGRPSVSLDPADLIYGNLTTGPTGPTGPTGHTGDAGPPGSPKCALSTHAGLANHLAFMTRYFAAAGDEVVLQNSAHTCDAAFWQLFWPLTAGGRCVIPPPGDFLSPDNTISTVSAHAITITGFVPSLFNVLVSLADGDAAARAKLASLRHVIVSGEDINPPMAHRLMAMLPGLSITNGYGPPETAIGAVFHRVTAGDGDTIPAGRPISNAYALVVDSSLNLLPPGATGEIAIGGVCVGAGYHRDPAATARAFPASPLAVIPGSRLFLTGDLGYFDSGGRLCLAGRKDSQVRIGGVRIELGEIEVAAENCPGVRHAVVLPGRLASRPGSGKVLALFVAGDDGLTEAALRRRLLRALPRPSVPRYIVVLREMPLTGHGKVDRRALRGLLDRKLAGLPAEKAGLPAEKTAGLMERDAALPPGAVVPGPPPPGLVPARVLVTGGTGFLGSQLVWELLMSTGLEVSCLVPAADDDRARIRLVSGLAARGLWRPSFGCRLTVYASDLSVPGLGLPPSRWQDLAVRCDLVLHCGTLVSLLDGYGAHRAVNVAGTAELLRLAADGRSTSFLQVSALGALSGAAGQRAGPGGCGPLPGPLPEWVRAGDLPAPACGYGQSAWVAERYLQAARERGAEITIVRPGEVMPAADSGWPNPGALTHLLLSAFARLGCCPDVPIRSDYTPVDYLAHRIVTALLDPAARGADLNVFRPGSVDFTGLLPRAGRPVQPVSAAAFVRRVQSAAERSGEPGLVTLAALMPGGGNGRRLADRLAGLLTDHPRWYGRDRCRALEQRHGLDDGAASPAPLAAYLNWLPAAVPDR